MKSISKMKTFWIGLIIFILYPCNLHSQLTITAIQWKWESEMDRSVSSSPILEQKRDFITIYSDKSLEDLVIEIKDLSGTIISQAVVTIPAGVTYSISIADLPSGDYTFKISQEKKYILGYFNK